MSLKVARHVSHCCHLDHDKMTNHMNIGGTKYIKKLKADRSPTRQQHFSEKAYPEYKNFKHGPGNE
ncbi:hypothetical protein HanIR_Chr04g0203841 [Helianthus annuus]|nr:hypothetical protein HanIR_Chr04g0203841 [Helianthus annuus]